MTQMQDPGEIWRRSLDEAPARNEEHLPLILRAEAWPYPDLRRLWIRLELSSFDAFPNLELILRDSGGQIVSTMFVVEVRAAYQSLTLHLRQEPRAGERYHLTVELTRDEQMLDRRSLEFALVFLEPG
jgi:hypothetical protein